MTSIYRQLGAGCEKLFQAIIQDTLLLTNDEVSWCYEIEKDDKTKARLTLDARIDMTHITKTTKPGKG